MSEPPSRDEARDHPTLASALADLQQQLPDVAKSETAEVEMKTGGKFRYTYAGLADVSRAVLPLLGKLGLSFSARPTLNADGKFVLAYELLHTSGQSRTGEYPIGGTTPQAVGSQITYARRYTLLAVTGLAPDDDDDAAAAQAEADTRRGTAQRATQPRSGRPPAAQATTAQRARPQAATPPPLPGDGDRITAAQLSKLHAMLREHSLGDRDAGLAHISGILGADITSTKDLTRPQARDVIDALEHPRPQPAPSDDDAWPETAQPPDAS